MQLQEVIQTDSAHPTPAPLVVVSHKVVQDRSATWTAMQSTSLILTP